MKRIVKFVLPFLLAVGLFFSFYVFKKVQLENKVVEYLINDQGISEDQILSSDFFIANLKGNKNYMVSVKLKNDDKTYFYYKNDGKIVLESYVENGKEYVQ